MKKTISFILSLLLLFNALTIPVYADEAENNNKNILTCDSVTDGTFSDESNIHNYTFTPTETDYYRFSFENESVECRTGAYVTIIGDIAMDFLNAFIGVIKVSIYDSREKCLAQGNISCGYTGSVSLKLEAGKTYTITLSDLKFIGGNYNIKVKQLHDIGGDTWETATETTAVSEIVSSIETGDDVDWYEFTTDSYESYYNFYVEDLSITNGFHFNLYEYLEGAGEFPFKKIAGGYYGSSATENLKLKPNTRYFYSVEGSFDYTGGYSISVTQKYDPIGNDIAHAYEGFGIGKTLTSSIDGIGDNDYIKFETDNMDAYYYWNIDNKIKSNLYISILDSNGDKVIEKYASGNEAYEFNIRLKQNSTYYICLSPSYENTGNYSLSCTQKIDDHKDTKAEATPMVLSNEYHCSIDGEYDKDMFSLTTDDYNAYYYFNWISSSTQLYVVVYDELGNKILDRSFYNYSTNNIDLKLKSNSKYYFEFRYSYDYIGDYVFSVTRIIDKDDDSFEKATRIYANSIYNTSMDGPGDVDCLEFVSAATAGYYRFSFDRSITGGFYVDLFDEKKELVQHTDCDVFANDEVIYYQLDANKTYYLKLSAYYPIFNYSVSYTFEADEAGDSIEAAASYNLNENRVGQIQNRNDYDYYKFTVTKPQSYYYSITSLSNENLELQLFNQYGGSIGEVLNAYANMDGAHYSKTVFLNSGTYYVRVKLGSWPDNPSAYYSFVVSTCGENHKLGSKTATSKASFDKNGAYRATCSVCNDYVSTGETSRIKNVSISYTSCTYNGSSKKPTVKVTNYDGKAVSSSYYTVKYLDANGKEITAPKKVGKYTVKVTFKGLYSGSKKLTYKINPKGTTISSVSAIKKGFKVKWNKQTTEMSGYQIRYSRYSNMSNATTVNASKGSNSKTFSNKAKKTKYYVQIRTYKTVNGTKYYSSWSSKKSVITK